jgi:hypothetical protein
MTDTNSRLELQRMGREWLANSPDCPSPGRLQGFAGPVGFVCDHCASRIMARGCNFKLLATNPVWTDSPAPAPCALCEDTA